MEESQGFLDFSQAGRRRGANSRASTDAEQALSRRTIPQYFLYGEASQDVDERFLHIESIAERSRRHDWKIRPHAHRDLHHLLYIDRGGGVFHAEGAAQAFGRRSLISVPLSCVHGFEFETGSDGWIVTASGALLSRIVRDDPQLAVAFGEAGVLAMDRRTARSVTRWLALLVGEFRGDLPARRAAIEAWLIAILVAATRRKLELAPQPPCLSSSDSALAARFRTLVDAHFSSSFGVAEYAKRLCVSPERLRVACVSATASSPLALLNARRLLEAKQSLLYTNMNVAHVAAAAGFSDPAYFSRFFVKSTGKSPRAYRQARQQLATSTS